jgi:tetratricopeptide (TPR) repeat protein
VAVKIQSRGIKWSAVTEEDGSFFVPSLSAGEYEVKADADSLPAGYSADALAEPEMVTVGATSPGKAAFSARAFRSIAGRVIRYDSKAAQYVPVTGALVMLREPGLSVKTDSMGRYLFRDLAAGSYTVSIENEAPASNHAVRLRDQPIDLTNVDFQMNAPVAAVAAPEVVPVKPPAAIKALPAKPQPPAVEPPLSRFTAEQHNVLGRQLTKEGRYREAIVELTEAVRIAPDFALAFNARGYVRVLLRDWAGAVADLNRAILLNPAYGNAYQLRAVARRAIGDAPGAASDLKKSQQLVH